MSVVAEQLVVEHLLRVIHRDSVGIVDFVLQHTHDLTVRCSLGLDHLFVEGRVRGAKADCLPPCVVHPQLVAAGFHALLALTVRHCVSEVGES